MISERCGRGTSTFYSTAVPVALGFRLQGAPQALSRGCFCIVLHLCFVYVNIHGCISYPLCVCMRVCPAVRLSGSSGTDVGRCWRESFPEKKAPPTPSTPPPLPWKHSNNTLSFLQTYTFPAAALRAFHLFLVHLRRRNSSR